MARAGRKRKQGKRQPDGRIAPQTDWQIMEPVLRRRCRELGWAETVDNMRKVKGQEGGTRWGKLYLAGDLDRRQYEAAEWFATKRVQYLRSVDAPKEHPKTCSMSPEPSGGSYSGESVEAVRRVRIEYLGADRLLRDAGRAYVVAMQLLMTSDASIPLHIIQTALRLLADRVIEGHQQAA